MTVSFTSLYDDSTEAYFCVRDINGTWIYCAQWSKDKFNLLHTVKEKLTSAMNRTQTFSTTWSDEEQHGFSIEDFWDQELTFFMTPFLRIVRLSLVALRKYYSK